jgi:threonine/homoserine/homoserine lactone efflux protein
MLDISQLPANLLVAYTAYAIGVASPGPSNLAIMGTAMSQGKVRAAVLAAGVISGSLLWGAAAALGLSSIMQTYSWTLVAMKLLGGAYLLWLAVKAARAAAATQPPEAEMGLAGASFKATYLKGLAMHLTNPKAIFVWLSIVAVALPQGARPTDAMWVVAGCGLIGATIFGSYALAFSTQIARRVYAAAHRWFNATLSAVFAYAGVRLLFSRSPA